MIKNLPERATSKENVAPGFHSGEGGVNPTVALQRCKKETELMEKSVQS